MTDVTRQTPVERGIFSFSNALGKLREPRFHTDGMFRENPISQLGGHLTLAGFENKVEGAFLA